MSPIAITVTCAIGLVLTVWVYAREAKIAREYRQSKRTEYIKKW